MRHQAYGVFLLALALTACGGAGSGGSPIPVPTSTPTKVPSTQYTSKLIFVGSLAGRSIQADLRQAQSASRLDATVGSVPIMVVSPLTSGMDTSAWGGVVEAIVSPMPSAAPATTFSQTDEDAVLQTPAPDQTPPAGAIADADVQSGSIPETQSAGVATASIGDPVLQSPTTPVYSYLSIDLECQFSFTGNPGTDQYAGANVGWQWNGSEWVGDNDPTTADIYIDGGGCTAPGSVNASESDATIHIPGGDARLSTDTSFASITASQWQNSETSFDLVSADVLNGDGSQNTVVIGKTRDGSQTFKLFPNSFSPSAQYFGAIEVAGSSVDGF